MTCSTDKPVVVLGVTGSIAAYKAADLASRLTKTGSDVHVVMTESATRLVQARTFQTLSQNPVVSSLWDLPGWQPGHVALSERADLLLIAPATANILAKMAVGIADDALSTQAISHAGAVVVAPAMNPRMWQHPAVQENVATLRGRGVRILGPDSGDVACGAPGAGRMVEPQQIAEAVNAQLLTLRHAHLSKRSERLLVTAGPTCEDLDPVRFLSNRSSGRMGCAIAAAGVAAGMEVTLISGPIVRPYPLGCRVVAARSAAEMAEAVRAAFPASDGLVMAAAVADYRPATAATHKIKKGQRQLTLSLDRTEDILHSLGAARKPGQWIVGFAAETENPENLAAEKRARKKLDWIAVNDVSRADTGFQSEQNELVLLSATDRINLGKADKLELAVRLLATVVGP